MTQEKIKRSLRILGIPVLAALIIRFLFDVKDWSSLWDLMTFTFFASLPYIVGALTIYLSKTEKVKNLTYRVFFPWIPILIFFFLTLLFSLEGWACWIMILPVFLFFASLGGLTAGYFKLRKSKLTNHLHLSIIVLLPFFIGPLEKMIEAIPGLYKASVYIDIEAPKDRIWSHVTRVKEIKMSEDHGGLTNFHQIPRPISAELDFEGVGAQRKAIFEGGLVFDEKVLKYEHQKMMNFSINANTYEIPSTTFDEHILIGGDFFDVLEGTYELTEIGKNKFRLHLSSEFKMTTTFNFYASIWGQWIMKDIQQNILKVIKKRSEEL